MCVRVCARARVLGQCRDQVQLLRLHGWDYTIEASVLEVYSCPPHSPRPTLNRTPLPHLRQDWARPAHIGTWIGLHRYNETLRDLLSPDASLSMKLDTEAKVEVR